MFALDIMSGITGQLSGVFLPPPSLRLSPGDAAEMFEIGATISTERL
jgi:hypothetical protein